MRAFCFRQAPLLSSSIQKGLQMRLLIILLVLVVAGVYFLDERNNCFWHGVDRSLEWVTCLGK